jgi:type IV secretory pathway VirB2 component (pilin)
LYARRLNAARRQGDAASASSTRGMAATVAGSARSFPGDVTMRWIVLLLAVLGFGLGFSAKAPGLMGLGFVLGFVFLIVAFFAFAAARVAESSRPDSTLLTDKDLNALRASMRARKPANSVDAAASNHPNPG